VEFRNTNCNCIVIIVYLHISAIQFTWNPRIEIANQHKHGVSFSEAQTVFYDERALLITDSLHSEEEDRFILLGLSSILRLLVVCHRYCMDTEFFRIISARRATGNETGQYTQGQ
jgi:uncharacterized DUF497 family protein